MVQNKSGMTSDSLVDIAELIPDAAKYEVSAWITENIVILNETENNLNAKDSFTLRRQRTNLIKIFLHWVSSLNGFWTQLWRQRQRQQQWKKWVSWQQVVVLILWRQRQF